MRRQIKCLAVAALTGILAVGSAFPAFAARKKITSISLEIEADIQADTDFGDEEINIDSKSEKYSVDGYDIENDGFQWERDTVPEITIFLKASDDYYFSTLKRDRIRLKGSGATYVSGTRKDSGETLEMTVKLDSLEKSIGQMGTVLLTEDGIASWDPVVNAGSYEIRIYRDGKSVGTPWTTEGTTYYCGAKMTKSANYYARIRAINQKDTSITSEWVDSLPIYVDAARADYFETNVVADPESVARNGAWKKGNGDRWWYDNGDGTYPANCWKEIGSKWYFFDGQGYMKTGWIQWEDKWYFCDDEGAMMSNCITTDNYWLGPDGAMINQ